MTQTLPDIHPQAETSTAAIISVEMISKSFSTEDDRRQGNGDSSRNLAVDAVSFSVQAGELFTLLGPSGCGKTTILRSIAGLERPEGGRITIGGETIFDASRRINVSPESRRLGMVFQSYAIWPHMSVFRNVSLPLEVAARRNGTGKAEIKQRVLRVLEVTELGHLADRSATKLSGGQQQRLALARALVVEPRVMLLDEPLSNLDATLRESMRFELRRLQRELGLTSIYVTHDQTEALALSSRIAVLNAGRIVQVGRPRDIYEHPNCRFVADFIGITNFLDGVVKEVAHGRQRVTCTDGELWVTDASVPAETRVTLSIRPEAVTISETPPSNGTPNVWRAQVVTRAFVGDSVEHILVVGSTELRNRSNPSVSVSPSSDVFVTVDPAKIVVITI